MDNAHKERKARIIDKASDVFKRCGFEVMADEVVGRQFVLSNDKEDDTLSFGIISSFEIINESAWLYPKFERGKGYNNVDSIVLHSGEAYNLSDINVASIFRNDPKSEFFFDFI